MATATRETGELLNEIQAAKLLGVSRRWMQDRRVNGGGPRFVKLGRTIRYPRTWLLEYVEENAFESTAEY